MLAGMGAAALPQLTYRVRRLLALLFATIVSAAVYTFGVFWQLPGQTAVNQWIYLAVAVGTIGVALVLVVCMVLPGWDGRRQWLLTGALLINLFTVNMGTNLSIFGPERKTILAPEMIARKRQLLHSTMTIRYRAEFTTNFAPMRIMPCGSVLKMSGAVACCGWLAMRPS
ncbi:MAG: hypothetical protein R2867_33165 [Caldilineaceae bacterium]